MTCNGGTLQYGGENYYPNAYHKVGDLFLTTNSENPSVRFGGAWELFGKGKVLVCIDEDDEDFNTIGKTVGEKTHTLTTDELPDMGKFLSLNWKDQNSYNTGIFGDGGMKTTDRQASTGSLFGEHWTTLCGGKQAHNNLQPSIVCYIWRRVK